VFSGVEGVQPQSETVWRQATRYAVPRLAFINKMDRLGADFDRVVAEMRTKLGANAWPVLIPIGKESDLRGQIDVINRRAILYDRGQEFGLGYSVEELSAPIASAPKLRAAAHRGARRNRRRDRRRLPRGTRDRRAGLKAAIRRQTVANRFVPVVGGSAFKYIGVQALLDAVVDYLPSPIDLPPAPAPTRTRLKASPSRRRRRTAARLVFKLSTDDSSRRHVFVRVYSGVLRRATPCSIRDRPRERISRVSESVPTRRPPRGDLRGDIAVVAGLKEVATGHTLCAEARRCCWSRRAFPRRRVDGHRAESRADQERLGFVLQRLAEDDPTFKVQTDPETGPDAHRRHGRAAPSMCISEKMLTNFKVATRAGAPEIAYKETITASASGEGRHIKQSGGSGQYGHVYVEVASAGRRGSGLVVTDKIVGGSIPRSSSAP
jgi:elongation factor G